MSLTGVTIEKLVTNRLPYLTASDGSIIGEFKCEVYHELGPVMGVATGDIEDDAAYSSLQKSLIADIVGCYMLFTKSIETLTGTEGKIKSSTFVGAGLDDATFSGVYTGATAATLSVEIDGTGTPDTFKWSVDGGAETTGVAITVGGQLIVNGVIVTFAATIGHTIGDIWLVSLVPGQVVTGKILTKAKAGSTEVEWEQLKSQGGSGSNGATAIKLTTEQLLTMLKKSAYRKGRNLGFIIDICEDCTLAIKSLSPPPSPPFIITDC